MNQLQMLKDRAGIKTWREFEERIGMRGAIHRWKTGKDVPRPDSLLKIKRAFNVLIDHLLDSEAPGQLPLQTFEHQPLSYDARPPASSDTYLIAAVVAAVDQFLDHHRLKVGSKRLGKIISLGYEKCVIDKIKAVELNIKALLVLTALIEE